MSTEENKSSVRRFFDGFNTGRLDVAGEFIAPGFMAHGPGTPGHTPGPEGYRQIVNAYHTAFPDLQIDVEDLIVEGDRGAARWRAGGTHRGDFLGAPATGRQVSMTGAHFFRIVGGMIEEAWVDWDMLGLLQQIGLIPMPGQARRRVA